ncbi:MAG: DUF5110 domain-containing protein [Bacteroidaceae bacterium]|nr:DUF5110 domain-containing protein [Bacteroidaceae bacterium]
MRFNHRSIKAILLSAAILAGGMSAQAFASNDNQQTTRVVAVEKINSTTVELRLSDDQRVTLDFYGDNIFRMFRDVKGGIVRNPRPMQGSPEAQILVDNPRKELSSLTVKEAHNSFTISTAKIQVSVSKATGKIKVTDLATGKVAFEEAEPVIFNNSKTTVTLRCNEGEFFYGGGVQNGRFSHAGKKIAIENTNSWNDGGVSSPTPFFWSTNGYGFMWHTFNKGTYDFGAEEPGVVTLTHESDYLDVFFMVSNNGVALLNDFYQLTGNPVLMPKFGFYVGHLNAYNRDYWTESTDGSGMLYEDGKRYKESQTDNGGIKESLNGEKNNYQFSARAAIDRYLSQDMPLGWFLPNDGYATGYGQTETLEGNVQNLKEFGDYARSHGVEIGLWTESNLHPREGVSALLQRDLVREVRDAGVRVLKTDVAWVGAGYSFGLNGVTDAAGIMTYYGKNARPFIISVDGWAGTQRYATIWSGDQTGGEWEYIRFHIPTFIGSGLSGQPNITSDVDGIFGGKNIPVFVREYQWKTYTPMMLNMDGWGSNEKYPHALGEPATSINRTYMKMKSELMPYTYSIAREAVDGKPMIRAMFLEGEANDYTMSEATRYQYMYGPYLLVAPIYQNTAMDKDGNDIRNNIYLPEGTWYDWFTGEAYEGGCIINNFDTPLWKLPVFVKAGAIIPMTAPNNNVKGIDKALRMYEIYPGGTTSFTEYDDDGVTEQYRKGEFTKTVIEQSRDEKGNVTVTIKPTEGNFDGFVKEKVTIVKVNASKAPKKVTARVAGKKVKLTQVKSIEEFNNGQNVWFYDKKPNLNRFATEGSEFEKVDMTKNPVIMVKLAKSDVTAAATELTIKKHRMEVPSSLLKSKRKIKKSPEVSMKDEDCQAYTINLAWKKVRRADYYEVLFQNRLYTTIKDCHLLFENLTPETEYEFLVRAVNKKHASGWTRIVANTKSNPLEWALTGVTATTSCPNQSGQGTDKLFDFDEGSTWHTSWGAAAVPFEMIIDLNGLSTLDKLHYVGRDDAGNGTIKKAAISYSTNKEQWSKPVKVNWKLSPDVKVFKFEDAPKARYIKIEVTEAVGNFGSGLEMYIFKVPGSDTYLSGDINKDNKVDENDLTSYLNYNGLRRSDSDFDYVSIGDVNENGLIDAYDISVAATRIGDGVVEKAENKIAGSITIDADQRSYKAGEEVVITINGEGLRNVNAFSLALPYDPADYEFVRIEALNTGNMANYSKNRLHGDGNTVIYPTFINEGNQDTISGDEALVKVVLKAKRRVRFEIEAVDGFIVDKHLNTIKF